MKSRFRNPPLLILSVELRGPRSPPWPWPPHFGRGSNKRSLRSIGSWTLSTCWNSVIMSRRLFSKAQIGSKSMVLKPLNWLKQRLNGRWINEEMWWNVVNPNKTSGIRPAKLRCNGLHHVFDGDMSGKFMECFRYGHSTNFINKKMWSRWDLLTEMVGCYHHLNGGLSLTWSENFPTGTTDGTGPVGTSEKSLGFSFCRFHVKKIGWNPQLSIFGRKYPMLMHRSGKVLIEVRITSPPALQIIEIPAEDHPLSMLRFPGGSPTSPDDFLWSPPWPGPWPTCCWRCVAHLWGS